MERTLTPQEWAENKDQHNHAATNMAIWSGLLIFAGIVVTIVGALGDGSSGWALYAGPALAGLGVQILVGLGFFWSWRYERRGLSRVASQPAVSAESAAPPTAG